MARLFRCQQQSDLWNAARRGRITGSGVMDMIAPPISRASSRGPKGTEAAAKEKYRNQLVVERIYKRITDNFVSRAMMDGVEREPFAKMLYEAKILGEPAESVGFALHPEWDFFGCSPDSVSWEQKGGQEYKCPTETTHDGYAQNIMNLVDDYKGQALCGLICFPEFDWWDLYSFSPYAPDEIKLVGYRFLRSEWQPMIDEIERVALEFNQEIEDRIAERGFAPTVFDILPGSEAAKMLDDGRAPEQINDYDPSKSFSDQDWSFLGDEVPM